SSRLVIANGRLWRQRKHAWSELHQAQLDVPSYSGVHDRLSETRDAYPTRRLSKVIFLDIDGVLNCQRTSNPRHLPYIVDDALLARFRQLVHRTDASVVLSSTWRYDPAGIFSAKRYGIPFIDVIPDLPHEPRRKEIL